MSAINPKREKLEISADRTVRGILLSALTECKADFRRMVEQYRRSIITEVSK